MAKIGASVVVDRPVDEVWSYATDWAKGPQWDPGLIECKVTSEGPLGVGTTLQSKRTSRGAHLILWHITEFEPGRKLTAEATSPQMMRGSRNMMTFESAEGKTKVDIAWDTKFNGFYSLLGPLLAPSFKKTCETQLGNLKRILESEPQP